MRSRGLALVLAVVLPALVLGAAAWRMSRSATLTGHARGHEAALRGVEVEVVVLGSSLANRGIDTEVLAAALGRRPDRVVSLTVPHATSAHHYAVLDNRVFREGRRPELVLIADALRPTLTHELLTEAEGVSRLAEQLRGDEHELLARVFGASDPWALRWGKARAQAQDLRSRAIQGWRDRWLQWSLGLRGRRVASQIVDRINEQLFAGIDPAVPDQARDQGPGWLAGRPVVGEAFSLREHGVLGLLHDRAAEHGARVVVARMPLPPSNAAMDSVDADLEAQARAWMAELGVGFVDLRGVPLSEDDFEDMRHLSRRGARIVSEALGDAVRRLDQPGRAPVDVGEPEVRRPPLPPLPAQGCVRESRAALWRGLDDEASVAPEVPWPIEVWEGEELLPRAEVAPCGGGWTVRGDRLVVAPRGEDSDVEVRWGPAIQTDATGADLLWLPPGGEANWTLGGASLPVRGRARAVGAPAALEVGARSWEVDQGRVVLGGQVADHLRLAAGDDGAGWWLVHHLSVGVPPDVAVILGRAETLAGAGARLAGGRLDDTGTRATFASAPPAMPPPRVETRRRKAVLTAPALRPLADAPDPRWDQPSRCSPVRATWRGEVLGPAWQPCREVLVRGDGATCHAGAALHVAPPDAVGDRVPSEGWGLALDPDRRCELWRQWPKTGLRGIWWLYPGDQGRFSVPAERLSAFRDGPRSLTVELRVVSGAAEDPIELRMWAQGQPVLDATWIPSAGPPGVRTVRLPLDTPLPPSTRDVELEVGNRSGGRFVLLTAAVLSESEVVELVEAAGSPWGVARVARVGAPPVADPRWRPWPTARARRARSGLLQALDPAALASLAPPLLSPVRWRDGRGDLTVATDFQDFLSGCARCVGQRGPVVAVRASGPVEVRFDESFPDAHGHGWLHPGQRGVWSPREEEEIRGVDALVRSLPVGDAAADGPASLMVGSRRTAFGPPQADGLRRAWLPLPEGLAPGERIQIEGGDTQHLVVIRVGIHDDDGVQTLATRP